MKNAFLGVSLVLCLAVLPFASANAQAPPPVGAASASMSTPSADGVYTFADLNRNEVYGLWKTLRKFRVNGARTYKYSGAGALVRTRFSVEACPLLTGPDAPFTVSWHCFARVTDSFKIVGKHHAEDNGVKIMHGASGDIIVFHELVDYGWDAHRKLLTVAITYATDPTVGPSRYDGLFNVQGISDVSVRTSSKDYGVNFSKGGFGFSLRKTEKKFLSAPAALVGPGFYRAETGQFLLQRVGGQTVFWTTMNWLADALFDYSEQVSVDNIECENTYKVDFKLTVKQEYGGEAKYTDGHTCRAFSDQLTAHILFRARPATRWAGDAPYEVGQRAANRIVIWKETDTSYRSFYEAGLTSVVNWEFDMSAADGSKTGGGFEVGSTGSFWDVKRGPAYVTQFVGSGPDLDLGDPPVEPPDDQGGDLESPSTMAVEESRTIPVASRVATVHVTGSWIDVDLAPRTARLRLVPVGGGQEQVYTIDRLAPATQARVTGIPTGIYEAALEVEGLGRLPTQRVALVAGRTKALSFRWPTGVIGGELRTVYGALGSNAITLWHIVTTPDGRAVRDSMAEQVSKTDHRGLFRFSGLAPGRYLLQARHATGEGSIEVTLARDGQDEFAILEIGGGEELEVLVLHEGTPVEGIGVYAVQQPYAEATFFGRTDASGYARLGPLPSGQYYVRASQLFARQGPLLEARTDTSVVPGAQPAPLVLELK